jgi:PH and SEC7 domain-containing protein
VNASKALQNWKNKSQFLTSEIVKYEIYVDALKGAMAVRHKRRGEKALEKALVEVNPEDTEEEPSESKQKQYARDAILETEEPISAGPTQTTFPKYNHESRSRTQSANYTPSS